MSLQKAKKLGPYEIIAPLGAGGMGEVYRALDPRIGREVAIKVLPSEFAAAEDSLARFELEARAAGMLNHPGILSIHEFGHENGTHYLVSELLEGETMRQKLGAPLSQRKIVDYAMQIAKALSAAHDKGIIHRDLKPENLFVTNDGRVKILDFGLAKLTQAETGSPEVSKMETGNQLSTPGMVLGTVGYMSPEQVRGKPADARSDIFAFGAILYEMISGKRAFHGETSADTMSAILGKEPPELSEPATGFSPAIVRIVEHCLEKDPAQRFQSMHDVAFYLETLSGVSASAVTAPVAPPSRSHEFKFIPWIVAAVMTIAAIALWFSAGRTKAMPPENPAVRLALPLEGEQRTVFNAYGSFAISPDGSAVVYTGVVNDQIRLYLRKLDSFESRVIPGTEDGRAPFFSPDGKWIGFSTAHELKKVLLTGGTPVTLCRETNNRGGTWGEDGTIVFCPFYYGGLSRVSSNGGEPQTLTTLDKSKGERHHRWPFMLPGGKAVLFTIGIGKSWSDARIGVVNLETKERKIVLEGGFGARYLPTGHLIFGRGNALYIIGFDLAKLETYGDPVQLAGDVGDSTAGTPEYAFSQNGTLVTAPTGLTLDEGGNPVMLNRRGEKILFGKGAFDSIMINNPRISPDNTRLSGDHNFEIWIYDLERGTSTRLTTGSRTSWAKWMPDGKKVTYNSESLGVWNAFSRSADGSDEEKPVFTSDQILNPQCWSPDGIHLILYRDDPQTSSDLVVYDTQKSTLSDFVKTPATELDAVFSPDGKWVAYRSDESGHFEIYVRSFGGPEGRWQVSTNGGRNPLWKQLNELLYMEGDKVMRVPIQTTPSFSAGNPEMLFQGPYRQMDVTSDHQRFIATVPKKRNQDYLNVVLNSFDEVRKLIPPSTLK